MSVLFPLLLLLSSLTLSALAQATCSAAMAPYILPSLNTTQKLAIVSPPQGAEVFDTTQGALNVYSGTTWQMLNPSFPDGLTVEGSLTMTSTTAALVPPTMTTAQKTAIANPPQGGVVFDTTQLALNVYTGTAWQPLGSPSNMVLLTSSGTWTVPTGVFAIKVTIMGGGAGGGGCSGYCGGGGGGAGGCAISYFAVVPGTQYPYTVGGGGGSNSGGGTTTFNGMVANGGSISSGGSASGGQINLGGMSGQGINFPGVMYAGAPGGNAWFGWGIGGALDGVITGADLVWGLDAEGFASGGSGGASVSGDSTVTGGSGTQGFVLIEY